MIGQTSLLASIDTMIEASTFPRFSILVGPEGAGKTLVVDYIHQKLKAPTVYMGTMVSSVRDMIETAYTVSTPTLFVLPDADAMSPQAKNALLKITEEPPNSAYIILTLTDITNTLSTIKSRGTVLYMQPYTADEIRDFTTSRHPDLDARDISYIVDLCTVPGEVEALVETGLTKFRDYVTTVVENIAVVSGANSFKIAARVQLKEIRESDETKFPLRLFWRAFMSECLGQMMLNENPEMYAEGVKITSRYLQELRVLGINRQNLFDMWVLDIRKAWM